MEEIENLETLIYAPHHAIKANFVNLSISNINSDLNICIFN